MSDNTPAGLLFLAKEIPMVVVFGRPGAGKSTIANATTRLLCEQQQQQQLGRNSNNEHHYVALDLDVCIPLEMKQEFSRGVYPTLKQRKEFALLACDYVDSKLAAHWTSLSTTTGRDQHICGAIVVSFSFVNNDLRESFRARFPNAIWALVDVTKDLAQQRIQSRIGHFYKGPLVEQKSTKNVTPATYGATQQKSLALGSDPAVVGVGGSKSADHSNWEFAPVTFPHIVLDGTKCVKENAEILIKAFKNFS